MRDKKNIKSISKIQSGYTFRTALKADKNGNITVLQAKDINDLYIDDNKLIKINHQLSKSNAIIKKNDVLFSVRGKFKASVYSGNLNNLVASSSVYILRINDKNIIPEFLAIYLNSSTGQREIYKSLTGGAIKTILRKDLENISVSIPDVNKQKIIINLHKNNIALQNKLDFKKIIINNITEKAISKILIK
ncbi:MAG: restriction endonuclease subunit S [Candidatus Pacebacteria bacterium]|nr:restriction endonuclease subunit S [Candidatus Paceibacterota bacterium]